MEHDAPLPPDGRRNKRHFRPGGGGGVGGGVGTICRTLSRVHNSINLVRLIAKTIANERRRERIRTDTRPKERMRELSEVCCERKRQQDQLVGGCGTSGSKSAETA